MTEGMPDRPLKADERLETPDSDPGRSALAGLRSFLFRSPARRLASAASIVAAVAATGPGIVDPAGSTYAPDVAVLTLTLIAIIWYTCFTYESNELASEAYRYARRAADEAFRRDLDRLRATLSTVRDALRELGSAPDERSQRQFQSAGVWSEAQESELWTLGSALGPAPALDAQKLSKSLRWMRTQLEDLRSEDPSSGFKWQRFPWDEWERHHAAATETAHTLRMIIWGSERSLERFGRYPTEGWRRGEPPTAGAQSGTNGDS